MGEVKKFRGRRTPVEQIVSELTDNAPKIRTAIVIARETDGSVFLRAHGGDGSDEDLLVLQRALATFVDEVWSNELRIEG